MTRKSPVSPDRIRTAPEQFSWVDNRLVRDRNIERLTHKASELYLFLVSVADVQGLSYYSDQSLGERLTMNEASLDSARSEVRTAFYFDLYIVKRMLRLQRSLCWV